LVLNSIIFPLKIKKQSLEDWEDGFNKTLNIKDTREDIRTVLQPKGRKQKQNKTKNHKQP
jgi:hypothetical protein